MGEGRVVTKIKSCFFDGRICKCFDLDVFQATGSWDKTVQVWGMNKKIDVHHTVLYGHTSNVKALAFSLVKLLVCYNTEVCN